MYVLTIRYFENERTVPWIYPHPLESANGVKTSSERYQNRHCTMPFFLFNHIFHKQEGGGSAQPLGMLSHTTTPILNQNQTNERWTTHQWKPVCQFWHLISTVSNKMSICNTNLTPVWSDKWSRGWMNEWMNGPCFLSYDVLLTNLTRPQVTACRFYSSQMLHREGRWGIWAQTGISDVFVVRFSRVSLPLCTCLRTWVRLKCPTPNTGETKAQRRVWLAGSNSLQVTLGKPQGTPSHRCCESNDPGKHTESSAIEWMNGMKEWMNWKRSIFKEEFDYKHTSYLQDLLISSLRFLGFKSSFLFQDYHKLGFF